MSCFYTSPGNQAMASCFWPQLSPAHHQLIFTIGPPLTSTSCGSWNFSRTRIFCFYPSLQNLFPYSNFVCILISLSYIVVAIYQTSCSFFNYCQSWCHSITFSSAILLKCFQRRPHIDRVCPNRSVTNHWCSKILFLALLSQLPHFSLGQLFALWSFLYLFRNSNPETPHQDS